ncbi:hypothetical protein HMPREF3198_00268 [Winkia neuii]|nr:hypothetical protein HMPREF3198_00268 [Winkia neuii]
MCLSLPTRRLWLDRISPRLYFCVTMVQRPVFPILPHHKIISKGVVYQVLKAIDRSRND